MEKQIGFKYEPLTLTRLLLQIYLEKTYDRNEQYERSVRFAIFEFMRTLENDELEKILEEYVSKDNVEAITFEDDKDCERITHYFMLTDRYKDLVFMYQKKGYSGLGVADNSYKTFYPCDFAHHWQTVGAILREKYGDYGKAFDKIMYLGEKECNGITSADLDKFILDNFQLVGETKSIENHLEDR